MDESATGSVNSFLTRRGRAELRHAGTWLTTVDKFEELVREFPGLRVVLLRRLVQVFASRLALCSPSAPRVDPSLWRAERGRHGLSARWFRVARPRRTRDGFLVVEGWCAWERVEGMHEDRRWPDIIAVGERFHAALAEVPRPSFIDGHADPWAIADRVAWGELLGCTPGSPASPSAPVAGACSEAGMV